MSTKTDTVPATFSELGWTESRSATAGVGGRRRGHSLFLPGVPFLWNSWDHCEF
jgi:hypothetical protein